MFSLKGEYIAQPPTDVVKCHSVAGVFSHHVFAVVLPLVAGGANYAKCEQSATLSFTKGSTTLSCHCRGHCRWPTREAFVAVIGLLVEVPVLIALRTVSLYIRRRYFAGRESA